MEGPSKDLANDPRIKEAYLASKFCLVLELSFGHIKFEIQTLVRARIDGKVTGLLPKFFMPGGDGVIAGRQTFIVNAPLLSLTAKNGCEKTPT